MATDLSIRPSGKDLQPFIDEFIKKNGVKKWTDINIPQRSRFVRTVIPVSYTHLTLPTKRIV